MPTVGYPLTQHTIRPFADYDLTNDAAESQRRKTWNRQLLSLRISIEHAFGLLKGRFPYLRQIPGWDLEKIYKFVEALMVVHNILILQGDDPHEIEGFVGDAGVANGPGAEHAAQNDVDRDTAFRMGTLRRKQLLDLFK